VKQEVQNVLPAAWQKYITERGKKAMGSHGTGCFFFIAPQNSFIFIYYNSYIHSKKQRKHFHFMGFVSILIA
jgi:hypothetical protein